MTPLMQALKTRVLARLGMQLFFGRKDSSTPRPYIVATEINIGAAQYCTGGVQTEEDLINLFVYADTDEDASFICTELEDELVGYGESSFNGGKIIQGRSNGFSIAEVPRRHPNAIVLWLGLLKVKLQVQRTL